MPLRLPVPFIIRAEGLLFRIIHSHGEGIGDIESGHTKKYTRPTNIPRNDGVFFVIYPFLCLDSCTIIQFPKKDTRWEWTDLHTEAFELCKQVLTNAPVRGYTVPGSPYRLYLDACNFGLAAILQQVQKIQLKDLKGTKIYEKCEKAFSMGEPVPNLVIQISKTDNNVPPWGASLEEMWVYIE